MDVVHTLRNRFQRTASAVPDLREAFKDPTIPTKQRVLADRQLAAMYAGHPPRVFSVCADALNSLPGDDPLSLLEVGCASGYYLEIIRCLVRKQFTYTGVDFSESMIALATERYPDAAFAVADARELPFASAAYDVVLAGAILEHVGEWSKVLDELCRVSKRHLVLHRTVVSLKKPTYTDAMRGYDVALYRTYINEAELLNRLAAHGFAYVSRQSVEPAPSGTGVFTYVFRRG